MTDGKNDSSFNPACILSTKQAYEGDPALKAALISQARQVVEIIKKSGYELTFTLFYDSLTTTNYKQKEKQDKAQAVRGHARAFGANINRWSHLGAQYKPGIEGNDSLRAFLYDNRQGTGGYFRPLPGKKHKYQWINWAPDHE